MSQPDFGKIVRLINLFGYYPNPNSSDYREKVMQIYQKLQRDADKQLHKNKLSFGMEKDEYVHD